MPQVSGKWYDEHAVCRVTRHGHLRLWLARPLVKQAQPGIKNETKADKVPDRKEKYVGSVTT